MSQPQDPQNQAPDNSTGQSAQADASAADASSSQTVDQASIDDLLKEAGEPMPVEAALTDAAASAADASESHAVDQASIDDLLKDASFEAPSDVAAGVSETNAFAMPDFQQAMRDAQVSSIDLLRDVDLNVKIELGRSRMLVEDVLKLAEGSVVELDKLAGDPVDVFVNDRLVARGEVLVLNDNFCVRINEIVAGVKEEGT